VPKIQAAIMGGQFDFTFINKIGSINDFGIGTFGNVVCQATFCFNRSNSFTLTATTSPVVLRILMSFGSSTPNDYQFVATRSVTPFDQATFTIASTSIDVGNEPHTIIVSTDVSFTSGGIRPGIYSVELKPTVAQGNADFWYSRGASDKAFYYALADSPITGQAVEDFVALGGAFSTRTVNSYCDTALPLDTSTIVQATITFFPNGMCKVAVFLFIPSSDSLNNFSLLSSNLQGKIPFSYVYGLQSIFSGLTASSTANLTSLSIAFPDIGSTTPLGAILPASLTVLSTSTIGTYLPESVRLNVLSFQRIFLWMGFILLIYRRVIPHKVL